MSAAQLYGPEATRRTYAHLQAVAARALADGWPVVVDAASLRREERQALAWLLECRADAAQLPARITARLAQGQDASDATPAVLALQQGFLEPACAQDGAGHAVLQVMDTRPAPAAVAAACQAWVRAQRGRIGWPVAGR